MELALEFIATCNKESKTCAIPDVAGHLAKHDAATVPTSYTLRRRLYENGVRFLETARSATQDLTGPEWVTRKSRYAVAWARALARESATNSDTVLVYSDETFAHTGHARGRTLVNLNDPKQIVRPRRSAPKAVLRSGVGKGRLHIIVHACTRDGLLVGRDEKGEPLRPDEDHAGAVATAEKVWLSNKATETCDYHQHYDSEMCINYCKTRLFPAFRSKYPGKRMVFIIDNSATHRAMPPDFLRPSSSSKGDAVAFLRARGVRGIWSTQAKSAKGAARVYLPPEVWEFKHPKGPSKPEVVEALRDFYCDPANAQFAQSRLERLFVDEVFHCSAKQRINRN